MDPKEKLKRLVARFRRAIESRAKSCDRARLEQLAQNLLDLVDLVGYDEISERMIELRSYEPE